MPATVSPHDRFLIELHNPIEEVVINGKHIQFYARVDGIEMTREDVLVKAYKESGVPMPPLMMPYVEVAGEGWYIRGRKCQ